MCTKHYILTEKRQGLLGYMCGETGKKWLTLVLIAISSVNNTTLAED